MAYKFETFNGKSMLTLKSMQRLEFKEDIQNGIIKYGKDNLYPQDLVRLYNEHPEHRAIVNRKARYIWGKGLKAVIPEDDIKVKSFIDTFNRKETLNQVGKKLTPNLELFNGIYIEVITNLLGKPIEYYFLNSANCRISEDKSTYYCKRWTRTLRTNDESVSKIEKFDATLGKAGTFFLDFSYYAPTGNYLESVYPIAQYQSIVDDINTDIDISTFNKNYVSNGFSVGKIISFFGGAPSEPQVEQINRAFKGTYTGEEGESIMITHSDRDDKAPEVVDVSIADLSEKFAFTSKRAQKKIFVGHEMASELFNIKFDDSFLSGSPDLLTLQELFVKGYIEPRQNDLLEFLSYLAFLKTGEYLNMMFEPISLIGADLSNDVDLTQDERRKIKGYAPLTAPKLDASGAPLPIQASEANDAMKGLSATENRDMQRIVRDFQAGKNGMNEHLAIARLTSYGLTNDVAKKILGINSEPIIKMSLHNGDKILMALESCAINDNDEDEILLSETAHIHNSKDALKYERQIMKFADALVVSVEVLDNAVLNALKINPLFTIDEIATDLNYDALKVSESIARLTQKGFLVNDLDGFKPTQKAIDKQTEPNVNVEVYTVYKYALNEDKPALKKGGTSRPFCNKMLALSLTKSWSFETIDNMENDLGTNVWDYRGGYYTNPNGTIDPDCRHLWMAITKRKTIK
jgi:hypothetical protein